MTRYLRATGPEELSRLESGRYDGLQFGAEFCHRRLPSPAEVRDAAALCRGLGIGFAVVTPAVREGAFDGVSTWLLEVSQGAAGAEWTSNDWGLLAWAPCPQAPRTERARPAGVLGASSARSTRGGPGW